MDLLETYKRKLMSGNSSKVWHEAVEVAWLVLYLCKPMRKL